MSVEIEMLNEENGRLRRAVKTFQAELAKRDAEIAEWIKQNSPNGWIDNLRKRNEELEATFLTDGKTRIEERKYF